MVLGASSDISSACGESRESGSVARARLVLVAADDDLLGRLLVAALTDGGYRVVRVRDGNAALERLRIQAHPSVALLSFRWPPLNSRAVLTAVAADPSLATRHAYVLLAARWDMLPPDYAALLARLGVPVVPKPFELEHLLGAVARAAQRAPGG